MDPAMCDCVWLTIVVVSVCRLGEVYGCGCRAKWARGILFNLKKKEILYVSLLSSV